MYIYIFIYKYIVRDCTGGPSIVTVTCSLWPLWTGSLICFFLAVFGGWWNLILTFTQIMSLRRLRWFWIVQDLIWWQFFLKTQVISLKTPGFLICQHGYYLKMQDSFCYFSNIHYIHAYRLILLQRCHDKVGHVTNSPQTLVSQDIIKLALCLTTHVEGWCSSSCPNARNPPIWVRNPPMISGATKELRNTLGVPSTFELDTAATKVQYKTTADDVDFVSRCSGTTTAQTWIASRLCSPCWRGLPHGASSSETMRARKKIFSSVGLNRCVDR